MAVKSFATNNLIAEHDIYVDFMKKRYDYMKGRDEEPTDILFCNGKGRKCFYSVKEGLSRNYIIEVVCKWHCMVIAYDAWCVLVKDHVVEGKGTINYKRFVDVPEKTIEAFKKLVENKIERAGCDYNKRCVSNKKSDACRYLAMFWTYLDIKKDCITQRFFPSISTCARAGKVFGYADENPFTMNGKFMPAAKKKENVKMADTTNCFRLEDLDFSQRTYSLLKRAFVNTLDDILKKSFNDLIKINNMGKHSLDEITEKLRKYGYEYKDCDGLPQPIQYPRDIKGFDKNMLLIDIIEDRRLTNPLHRASIHTVGDFLSWSDKELLKIRTFGVVKLEKVRAAINDYIKQTKDKEESVIDIAEQAAEEIEEKRRVDPMLSLCKSDEYEELRNIKKKYDELLKVAQENADKYDVLLKEKMEYEQLSIRLKEDVVTLKEDNRALQARCNDYARNLGINADDIFALIKGVVTKMKKDNMTDLTVSIDNLNIDIRPKGAIRFPSNYKAYVTSREG